MNQSLGLSQHQSLQQTLSPQMIQSLKLLQVTALQLEQLIKQEIEINPLLEELQEEEQVEETPAETEATSEAEAEKTVDEDVPEDGELKVEQEEIDWEEYLEDGFDLGYRQSEDLSGSDNEFESVPAAEKTLEDHLFQQLNERNFDGALRKIVEHLVGCMDVYGYMTYPIADVAADLKVSVFQVEEALNILQQLDPPGIGARNLRECLLIQLRRRNLLDALEGQIIAHHFDLLQKLKITEIANSLGRNVQDIQTAVHLIGTLNPRPAESLVGDRSQTIIPDIIVEKITGKWVAYLNDSHMPRLQINRAYASLMRNEGKSSPEIKTFIKDKMTAANWLIKAIEQRKTTMLRVMNAILELQGDFFDVGPALIKPLIMQTVADKIGMHVATVSRVVNGKYCQSPHGVFELKSFFTAGIEQDDGSEVSATRAMNSIRELIENEDTKNPLSDQRIVQILKDRNMNIARRTVAKYRDRLKILPARLRKQY